MKNPITVAILTYNRPEYLATALRSVCNQQLEPAEILIIDDGSTAETREVVEAFKRYSPAIRYVWQENVGKAASRNRAIRECKTSHILWLDDDDALTSNAVVSQFECLKMNPDADVIYGMQTLCDHRLVPIEPLPCYRFAKEDILYLFFKHNPVPTPGTLINLQAFNKVGLYNVRFRHSEGYDFFARAASEGLSFVRNPSMLVFHRSHKRQLAASTQAEQERALVIESLLERESLEDIFYIQPWESLADRALFNSCLEASLLLCSLGAFESATSVLAFAGESDDVVNFLISMIEAVQKDGAQGMASVSHNRALFEGPGEQLLDVLLERTLEAEEMDSLRAALVSTYLERASLEDLYTHLPWEEQPELALLSACIEHACRCVRYGDFESALDIMSQIENPSHAELSEFIMKLIKAFQRGELETLNGHPLLKSDAIAQLLSVFQERSERYRVVARERLFANDKEGT